MYPASFSKFSFTCRKTYWEQFYLLEYNTTYSAESQQTFRRNMSPSSSSSNKPRNKPVWIRQLSLLRVLRQNIWRRMSGWQWIMKGQVFGRKISLSNLRYYSYFWTCQQQLWQLRQYSRCPGQNSTHERLEHYKLNQICWVSNFWVSRGYRSKAPFWTN
jgi:hypothetical protein